MTETGPHQGQRVAAAGPPLGRSHAVMIMVHGRNAAPENILDLCGVLDRPGVTYLAPAAAGGTWYPLSFLAERSRNEPALSSALRALEELVEQVLAHGIERRHLLLLGFSQGACLASEFAARHPGRYGGVVAFSGGLIGPPGTEWHLPGSFDGTPVFLGCSDVDAHVPRERVDQTAVVFERMGAEVTRRIYPGMGHLVSPDEVAFTQALMDRVLVDRS
ncbi:MAG: putative esterase [Gemmatimonadetes bacterium]|nr:putative esterase [Gemmatimonadota bacterium]